MAGSIVSFEGANALFQVHTVLRYTPNCLPVGYSEANQVASRILPASSKRLVSLLDTILYSGKQIIHSPSSCTGSEIEESVKKIEEKGTNWE